MKDIKLQIKYRKENMQLLKEGQLSIKKNTSIQISFN